MRILHFGPEGGEENFFAILTGFRNLGHKVLTCNVIQCPDLAQVAEQAIISFQPDIVLTIGGWHQHFDAKLLWQIVKKYSLPNIYWAIEDPTFFDWVSLIHAKAYDYVFTCSEECLEKYSQLGVPAVFLPYAINPAYHRPLPPDPRYKNEIVAMANKVKEYDPERCRFRNQSLKQIVEPILHGPYDIKLYGSGWNSNEISYPMSKLGGYISPLDVLKAYSGAKISLAIQWDFTGHVCFRTFESLAMRCLLITPYTPAQEKFFQHGVHLLYSHSAEETMQYVDYFLKHETELERIAAQGQTEVYKNHNCTMRALMMMDTLYKAGLLKDAPV